ncbi:MAG TPA: hypothetical protein VIU45_04920 [Chitinophagaceae bacterium]
MKTVKIYFITVVAVLTLVTGSLFAQEAGDSLVFAKNTTASFRNEFYTQLVKWTINKNLASPLADQDDAYDFSDAFWPMELTLYRSDYAKQRIQYAFANIRPRDTEFQRGLLELVYTTYPFAFKTAVEKLMQQTTNPKVFAMCAEYLWKGGAYPDYRVLIARLLKKKFPVDSLRANPVLLSLDARLGHHWKNEAMPPLTGLLSEQFAPGLTVMYSFQRPDRDYPGLVVVRRPDGYFVRNADSTVFHVRQLARAINNLPFYLTNGNTPQGIFRMSGFGVSRSQFIGPTQNIQLSMPFEIPADSFIVSYPYKDTGWEISQYKDLLPPDWQHYQPVYESFYAGKAGRTAIIAHGTTIDPAYYKGQVYFPQTPSLGCLCARESWSPANGQREESDQQKLVDAVKQAGNGTGYCVVIALSDKKEPVQLQEVLPYIMKAEAGLRSR